MKRKLQFLLLILGLSSIIGPGLIRNAFAFGCSPTCNLDVITHVPIAEKPGGIRIASNFSATVYTMNHTFTFPNRTRWTITVLDTYFIGAASGNVYRFKQWTYTGTGQQWDATPTMTTPPMYANYTVATCYRTLNCPFLAEFTVSPPTGCKTNCYLDALTNVRSSDGTIKVQDKSGAVFPLSPTSPQTFAWPNASRQTLQVLNTSFTGASGTRYAWKQWVCACTSVAANSSTILTIPAISFNYTNPARNPPLNGIGGFTAQFDKLYPLTLTFRDMIGDNIVAPSSLLLVNGNTVINLTSFTGAYEAAVVWTVRKVVWEGVAGVEVAGQTIDLTQGAQSVAITVEAYPATIKTVDNSNNPLSGTNVTVTFYNSTVRTFRTNSQGLVSLGDLPCTPWGNSFVCTYPVTVNYKGTTVTGCCSVDISNPSNNPYSVQIPIGISPVTTPLVSAAVLLVVFGLVMFLILLAIRVRKRPAPPVIE